MQRHPSIPVVMLTVHQVSPRMGNQRTSIVSARFPGQDPATIVNRLGARGIIVSSRRDFVRLSLHLYNSNRDVDRVLTEVPRRR